MGDPLVAMWLLVAAGSEHHSSGALGNRQGCLVHDGHM